MALALETAHADLRARIPRFERDRMFSPAIAAVAEMIDRRAFEPLAVREAMLLSAQ